MTIIQPNHSNVWLNRTLVLLVALVVFSAAWLVSLYTQLVNLNHGISQASSEIQDIQTANAELKDRIFGLFDQDRMKAVADARSLIKDREPQYLEADKWSLAASQP
ncbi:MAG: hypothetical protein UY99_C0005G0013 [Parcubacteria group bacterium GW2011_GWA1_59_11]|nr:MAG: hypothetical protein UY99_C0005G0013 [Parcubacteria group bacterium GW2011_GWA1_59_11]